MMEDHTVPDTTDVTSADTTEDIASPPAADAKSEGGLTEGGYKALVAERDARRDAERRLTEIQRTVADLTAARDAADKAAAEAAAERDALRAASQRIEATVAAGLPHFWADRLKGSTPEELRADAEAIRAQVGAAPSAPILPPDPSQGRGASGRGGGSVAAGRDLYHELHKKN